LVRENKQQAVFRYPITTRAIAVVSFVMTVGAFGYYLLMLHESKGQRSPAALALIAVLALVLLLVALGNLKLLTTEVRIDETCIVESSILRTRVLKWGTIEDLVSVPHVLLLRGAHGRPRISLCRGEYGFSLGRFEEMKDLIVRKVEPLLVEKWNALDLKTPRSYVYPPLSPIQWGGYIAVFVYGTYLFVVGPLQYGGLGWHEMLYWMSTLLLIGPLLVRDMRRSRRRLALSEDGIRVMGGGETAVLRWDGIVRIVVKGNSIRVEGREPPGVCVPLRMLHFGELFFFLRTRSRAELVQA